MVKFYNAILVAHPVAHLHQLETRAAVKDITPDPAPTNATISVSVNSAGGLPKTAWAVAGVTPVPPRCVIAQSACESLRDRFAWRSGDPQALVSACITPLVMSF